MNKKLDSQKWEEQAWSPSPGFLNLSSPDILDQMIVLGTSLCTGRSLAASLASNH